MVSESERWARIKSVFDAAVACPAGDRPGLLREMCGDDPGLQASVESLLAADAENPSGFAPSVDGGTRGRVFDAVADVLDARTGGLSAGDRLGDYEIRGFLGAGGMGRAYRARDLTLGRDVGLKILSGPWLTDPERGVRFDREARVLASLNHPNIGSIYGVIPNDAGATTGPSLKALVLELVEGETLAERLARQAVAAPSRPGLPLSEVVDIAGQMIDAIEAAHEHGIVHRDLKPANIKVTPEGRVKVLDFGLARLMSASGERDADPAATAAGVTQNGVLLGTAPYMSPEQARGRTVDKRSDIWSFGCVLYEMLAGAPAFAGDGTADLLANVVTVEPDWGAFPPDAPPALRMCVQRCLQKDLRQRFHDIADVRLAMEGAFEPPASGVTRRRPFAGRYASAGWAAVALATGATLAIVAFPAADPLEPLETRLEIVTPPAADPLSLAISPDGRSVVFQAGRDVPQLWLRRLDSPDARPIGGTEGARQPFWSPDSRSVGFGAGPVVKRVDLDSGLIRTVANTFSVGGAWAPDGTILLGSGIGPLHRGRAEGGALTTGHCSVGRPEQSPVAAVSSRWAIHALRARRSGNTRPVSRVHGRTDRSPRGGPGVGLSLHAAGTRVVRARRRTVGARSEAGPLYRRGRAVAGCAEGARGPECLRLQRVLHVRNGIDCLQGVGRCHAIGLARSGRPSGRHRGAT